LYRGRALESLDRPNDALHDYEHAVELAPPSEEAQLRLAAVLNRLGRPWDAVAHYEYLRQRQPTNPDVLLGLARCRYELHELDQACLLLDRLLEARPNDTRALLDRGRLEFHAGHTVEAERWLRHASELAPHDHDICLSLCQCLEAQGKETEARVGRERLRQIEAEYRLTDDLIEESKQVREDAALRYRIGARLQERGQEEDAVSWFYSALGEDPRHAPAHLALADYFERTGQHYRAALHRQAAQEPARK
jgi:tetratricopeptide (TPR) repeat protein